MTVPRPGVPRIAALLTPDRVRVPLRGWTKEELLAELVDLIAAAAPNLPRDAALRAVRAREQVLSTGVGGGLALPHGRLPGLDRLWMAAGVTAEPVEFDALDGQPVRLVFLLLGPADDVGLQVRTLGRLARLLRQDVARGQLIAAPDAPAFIEVLARLEAADPVPAL